ncbi:MAG: hypothetical protein EOP74_00825 [Variovorax sp.]|nr:MAG: hypothetical protein EOP74_00825 [Variovorax sp.]
MSVQSLAQNYLLALKAQPLLAYSALSEVLDILQNYGPDEFDEAKAAVQQYYTDNGLAIDPDTLSEALETLQSSSLEFWQGVYHIPHPDAGTLRLSVGADTVTLTSTDALKGFYFSVPSASVSFADRTLNYEDDKVQFSARLWHPSDLPENADVAPTDMATRNEARLTGTLSVKGDEPEGPYALTGKRGVFTAAGFNDPGYGDPASVWDGQYRTQHVDGDFSFLGTIALSVNADGSMGLSLGHLQATAVTFSNNTLAARLPTDAVIALRLLCTPNGVRSFTGAVQAQGITRWLAGTCSTLYATPEAAARRPSSQDRGAATPDFCDTNIDQVLTLAQLGVPVEPLKSLKPVRVVFADGSPGSIVITPIRAADVYRVPPGAMVAYRPPATAQSDDALQVAWQLDEGHTLLRMIEPDYYQLRVTLSDAQSADHKGIDIAMALDAPGETGFLSLVPPSAARCGAGTGGSQSPVEDFAMASVLLANTRDAQADGTLAYQFALSGKSTSLDNAAGDHDGFLCATLTYETEDGSQKYPPRRVRIPLLCPVSLPVTLAPPLAIEGMPALPVGYPNRPALATLSATGGVQPIAWASTSAAPDGLAWTPSNGGGSFTLGGTLGGLPAGQSVPVSVSAQSDPGKVVSRVRTSQGALPVSNPPAQPANNSTIGWIAGAILFCGGVMALGVAGKWGWVDRAFVIAYIGELNLMLRKQPFNYDIVFDKRVTSMAEELRDAIRGYADSVLQPLWDVIEAKRDEWAKLHERLREIREPYQQALRDHNQALASKLKAEEDALYERKERLFYELNDLGAESRCFIDEIDRALEHT